MLWLAVGAYGVLQAALWAWKRWVERGEVFCGKRRRVVKRVSDLLRGQGVGGRGLCLCCHRDRAGGSGREAKTARPLCTQTTANPNLAKDKPDLTRADRNRPRTNRLLDNAQAAPLAISHLLPTHPAVLAPLPIGLHRRLRPHLPRCALARRLSSLPVCFAPSFRPRPRPRFRFFLVEGVDGARPCVHPPPDPQHDEQQRQVAPAQEPGGERPPGGGGGGRAGGRGGGRGAAVAGGAVGGGRPGRSGRGGREGRVSVGVGER